MSVSSLPVSLRIVSVFRCAGYVPIRTPARRLTATPTPLAGNATPVGFFMQKEGQTPGFQDTQPKGNLPFLKPEDAQYFDKLLVSDGRPAL